MSERAVKENRVSNLYHWPIFCGITLSLISIVWYSQTLLELIGNTLVFFKLSDNWLIGGILTSFIFGVSWIFSMALIIVVCEYIRDKGLY